MNEIVRHNGDVRNLLVYKLAVKISVITEIFIKRFVPRGSRTIDQMQQASRSCKQNIVEGSEAAATSKETEIKLTNVARASLGELEEDYRDCLLFNKKTLWGKDHPRVIKLREYIKTPQFDAEYRELCQRMSGEEMCNLAITLIKQTQYLLDRLISAQEKRFLAEGGIREAMTRARLKYRNSQTGSQTGSRAGGRQPYNQNNQNNWNNQNNPSPPASNNSNSSNNSNNSNKEGLLQ